MIEKKYPSLSWKENFLGGHVTIGRVTIFGENAMHWAVNIQSKKYGSICFRLPFRCFGQWWPLYFYVSPNRTPCCSTFYLGNKYKRAEAKKRREKYGHNFDTDLWYYRDNMWIG